MSSYCPQCGNLVVEGAQHCTQCGAALVAADDPTTFLPIAPPTVTMNPPAGPPLGGTPPPGFPAAGVVPPPTGPPPGAPPPAGYAGDQPPRANTALIVAVAVLATLLVVGIVAVVLTRGGDDDTPTTTVPETSTSTTASTTSTTTSTTSTTTSTTSTTTTTAPPATSAPTGDVTAQPAGLFCRDLNSRGFSYADAVTYWQFHDQPARMDADRNGIPCETVYPRRDVIDYWGSDPGDLFADVPAGLKCADLKARGFSYPEAVAYWFATGAPDLMDADLNGIPCETVYPQAVVDAYWFGN